MFASTRNLSQEYFGIPDDVLLRRSQTGRSIECTSPYYSNCSLFSPFTSRVRGISFVPRVRIRQALSKPEVLSKGASTGRFLNVFCFRASCRSIFFFLLYLFFFFFHSISDTLETRERICRTFARCYVVCLFAFVHSLAMLARISHIVFAFCKPSIFRKLRIASSIVEIDETYSRVL